MKIVTSATVLARVSKMSRGPGTTQRMRLQMASDERRALSRVRAPARPYCRCDKDLKKWSAVLASEVRATKTSLPFSLAASASVSSSRLIASSMMEMSFCWRSGLRPRRLPSQIVPNTQVKSSPHCSLFNEKSIPSHPQSFLMMPCSSCASCKRQNPYRSS